MFRIGELVVAKIDPRHEARVEAVFRSMCSGEKFNETRVRVRFVDTGYLGYFNVDELIEPRNLPPWLRGE